MAKKKIMLVFGTRPEAIKMAPVVYELKKREGLRPIVAVSAQHRDMLDQVLGLFKIVPDIDLNIMRHNQTLPEITSKVVTGASETYAKVSPDMVLVQGDTTTTMAAALAAFYAKIPIGHIEAGLRTHDKYHPFPEEVNRKIVSCVADIHFAPTEQNRLNLISEGVSEKKVLVTGNTVIDALLMIAKKDYEFTEGELAKVDFGKKVLLVTCHRRENWGEPMRQIFLAVRDIAALYPETEVVLSAHSNPLVQEISREVLQGAERVHLVRSLDYEKFSSLMAKCHIVLSDSGGVQEEAPALGKPVLVLRTTTERPEGLEAGTVRLAGVERDGIVRACCELLDSEEEYAKMARATNPYGDGMAAQRIVSGVIDYFRAAE